MKKKLIHFRRAFVTVGLDGLWLRVELPATRSGVGLGFTSVALGLLCSILVMLIQRFIANDDGDAAAATGVVMGVVAGGPYPVMGRGVGAPLAGWSGIPALEDKRGPARDDL